jgi:hypothetical protein
LYKLPGIFTGNVENGVKVVHYGGGNWADILSGLGFFGDAIVSVGGVVNGNVVSKLTQPYQVGGSMQIGGAVIHVDGSNSSSDSSGYVVIGRNVSSNFNTDVDSADGIIIDNDNLDENGFFKGSWGYIPLAEESIQIYTGTASVKIMRDDGEKEDAIMPVVRPAIPAIVGGESGNTTEVQRLTLLNILQSNIINYFSFLLQTSPIATNPKMLATVEELIKRLLLGEINANFLLPQLEELISVPLQEQLQNVLKSFIPLVEPDFGLQILHLKNYLQEPMVVSLAFAQQIPTLTGGIDKRWVLPSVIGHPFYNTADANSLLTYDLRQLLRQNKELSDRQAIKYNVYLVMTTIPLPMDIQAAMQIRNLASVLYALKDSVWEMIVQRLSNMPLTSTYSGLKDFLQLVASTPDVPNEVIAIIENKLSALPNDTVSPTAAVHLSTNITLPRQPENVHSSQTKFPYSPQPTYQLKAQYESRPQDALQNQHPSQYQSLQTGYETRENIYQHPTQNKRTTPYQSQQKPQYAAQQAEYLPETQHKLQQPQYPVRYNEYQYTSQNKHTKQYQTQQAPQYSTQQAEYQHPLTYQQPSAYQSRQPQYSPNQDESQYTNQNQPPAQYQFQHPQYSPEREYEPQYRPQIEPQPQYPLQYQPYYPQQPASQPKPKTQIQWSPKIKLQPEYVNQEQSDSYQTQFQLSQKDDWQHQAQQQPKFATSRPQVQHEHQDLPQYSPQQESAFQHKTQHLPQNQPQPEHEHKSQYQKPQEEEEQQQFEHYQPQHQPQYTPYDQPPPPHKLQYPEAQYQPETQDQAQSQYLYSLQNQPHLLNQLQNLHPLYSEPHTQYALQQPEPQNAAKPHSSYAASDSAELTQMITIFPVGEVLDTPSESDLQNPSELLPVCSGYEGCSFIDKIRYLFGQPSIMKFILSLDINISSYSNKASLLLYIFQQLLSQIQLQANEIIAIQRYSAYLTSTLKPWKAYTPKPSSKFVDITYILPECTNTSLYCFTLKEIGKILLKEDIYSFLQDNVYSSANYPTKEAYLQSILQNLISRNLVSVKDMVFVETYLQYMKKQPNILVSGDALSEILKHIVQQSDKQGEKLFEIVSNWFSKENLFEALGDYKIDLSATILQLLKSILRFALIHSQFPYKQELRQVLQHLISQVSLSNTATNVDDSVEDLGIQIMGEADVITEATKTPVVHKRFINLNSLLKAVDKERLGEMEEQQLMEYFANEFDPNILSEGSQFWKYVTKGRWLKELLKHILNKTNVSPETRELISQVIPVILTTGSGAEPLDYVS